MASGLEVRGLELVQAKTWSHALETLNTEPIDTGMRSCRGPEGRGDVLKKGGHTFLQTPAHIGLGVKV